MGCGSSSLKGSDNVGTNAPMPAVPTEAPVKKVRTNFSNIDYDAPAETKKGSFLKARAPDELDEGPSRNASVAVGGAGAAGNLQGETKDGLLEKEPPAEKNALEPYHANNADEESKPTTDGTEPPSSRRSSLRGLLTSQEGRRKKSNFTDADLKRYAGISRDELAERAKVPPAAAPVPRYAKL